MPDTIPFFQAESSRKSGAMLTPPAPERLARRATYLVKETPAKPDRSPHEEDTASEDNVDASAASRLFAAEGWYGKSGGSRTGGDKLIPAKDISTPADKSTTKDAFAIFRTMVSRSRIGNSKQFAQKRS